MGSPKTGEKGKILLGADLVLPLMGLLLAGYYFRSVLSLPWIARAHGLLVGSCLAVLTVLLVVRSLVWTRKGIAAFDLRTSLRALDLLAPQRLGLIALVFGFVLVLPYAGFLLTVLLFLGLAMYVLGVREVGRLVGIAAAFGFTGYLLFGVLLNIHLPEGPLERLLEGLFRT